MATSLADQLKRLAIPHTNLNLNTKKRPSFLFDEKEAANLSRETVLDIGTSGLKALIVINPCLKKFEKNLFDPVSCNLQRAVESVESNKKINKIIQEFFFLVSPYFLNKSAHKALEWLINRYHVQELNVDDFMGLALPYHETKYFVRALQLLNLDLPDCKRWKWLLNIQKQGVHLPKSALINHCISDPSFLQFICATTLKAVKVNLNNNTHNKIGTLISFYCTTCVSVLSRGQVGENLLTVILPSIIESLSSKIVDLKAAGLTIVGQLMFNNQINEEFTNEIVDTLLNDEEELLRNERGLLLILIYQCQEIAPVISPKCLSFTHWIPNMLMLLRTDGVIVDKFVLSFLETLLREVTSGGSCVTDGQVQTWQLAVDIQYHDKTALQLIIMLDKYYNKISNSGAKTCDESVVTWLKEMIKIVIEKYSDLFTREKSNAKLTLLQNKWRKKEELFDNPLVKRLMVNDDLSVRDKDVIWKQVRSLLLQMSDEKAVFKLLCNVTPPGDYTMLLISLYKLTSNSSKKLVRKMKSSTFFKTNSQLNFIMSQVQIYSDVTLSEQVAKILSEQHSDNIEFDFDKLVESVKELQDMRTYNRVPEFWTYLFKFLMSRLSPQLNSRHVIDVLTRLDSLDDMSRQVKLEIVNMVIDYCSLQTIEQKTWWDLDEENSSVYVKLFEIIIVNSYEDVKYASDYQNLLSTFVQRCFENEEKSTLFVCAVAAGCHVTNTSKIQMLSLHTLLTLLNKSIRSCQHFIDKIVAYLLVALSSDSHNVRKATLKVIMSIVDKTGKNKPKFYDLLEKLTLRYEEITLDVNHVSLALHYLMAPTPLQENTKDILVQDREDLLTIICSDDVPVTVASRLLQLLEFVNTSEIFHRLTTFARRILSLDKREDLKLHVLKLYWNRLDEKSGQILEKDDVWSLAVECCKQQTDTFTSAVLFFKSINDKLFDSATKEIQTKLLMLMISTSADCESSVVTNAVLHVVKKITIDSELIVNVLSEMKKVVSDAVLTRTRRDQNTVNLTEILETKSWRHGTCLLELIQSGKSQLVNIQLLLPMLFDILQCCVDQDEQNMFEYVKQLVLGCLLDCCNKLNKTLDEKHCNVELIVRCLRVSSNPQTHHHALLLLSHVASVAPNQVMHNMMAIFTFMGSSVARLDDAYSVQVVTQVIETIIPVVVECKSSKTSDKEVIIASVLRVFVDALQDIPEHRRLKLFTQLLNTLGARDSFWILLLLMFEDLVYRPESVDAKTRKDPKVSNHPSVISFALQLCVTIDPMVVLESVTRLFTHLNQLPVPKMNSDERVQIQQKRKSGLFDVVKCTPKQLRHFAFTTISFPTYLLADQQFLEQVSNIEEEESSRLEEIYQNTISVILSYMPVVNVQFDRLQNKFWKAMVHQSHDVLDKVMSLVSTKLLVSVISKLLTCQTDNLQRKSLDLLNMRLQSRRDRFSSDEKQQLLVLLPSLVNIIQTISPNENNNKEILAKQQTALISVKFLAKLLAADNPDTFLPLLIHLGQLIKTKHLDKHVLASVVLCSAHLVSVLKAYAIAQLQNIFPAMLKAVKKYSLKNEVDYVLLSLVDGLLRVVDALPNFLSPYLFKLLRTVCALLAAWESHHDLQRKLNAIMTKISNNVPLRVLIPAVTQCYQELIDNKMYKAVKQLMMVINNSVSNSSTETATYLNDLMEFFTAALQFRSDSTDVDQVDISYVEQHVISAMLPLVLKLSEVKFKPLYFQLFHWASQHPDRYITFYRLSHQLAEKLKSLFVLFAGHILQTSAKLLDSLNTSKTDELYYDNPEKCEMLLENIIKTLHLIFLFDTSDSAIFTDKDKFEVLLNPLVDQIENMLGGSDALQRRTINFIQPCISQMALSTSDILWKSLNHQILLKMRHSSSQVKLSALETLLGVATKLGEDYLVLLPETIGSLAELLEDDDEQVESCAQATVQKLEQVLGQSIREYFK